jgi:molybdopterin synthase catalytic subunit
MGHLTHQPIDPMSLLAQVSAAEQGGITSFTGMVRNHQDGRPVLWLEYSAYEPMAEAECARIVAEARERWPVSVALEHRLGHLAVGEVAVAVAASAAHRGQAFDACRYVIEEVKRRVPIWKKEFYADGTIEWWDPIKGTALAAEQGDVPPVELPNVNAL